MTEVMELEHLALSPEQRAVQDTQVLHLWLGSAQAQDAQALRHGFEQAVRGQWSLNCRFSHHAGYRGLRQQPLQEPAAGRWQFVDLRGDSNRQAALDSEAPAFELASGDGVAARLFAVGDSDWRLHLSASALVADHASLRLLARLMVGGAAGVDEESGHFGQFVEWRQAMAEDEDAPAGQAYWAAHLRQASADQALQLPLRRLQGQPGQDHAVSALSVEQAHSLNALAESRQVRLDTLLQAAWWALLARIGGQSQVLAGWLHDCRDDYDFFAASTGVYEKTLPLVLNIDSQQGFARWLADCSVLLDSHRGWQEHAPAQVPEACLRAGFSVETGAPAGWQALRPRTWAFELGLQVQQGSHGQVAGLGVYTHAQHYRAGDAQGVLNQYLQLLERLPDGIEQSIERLLEPAADVARLQGPSRPFAESSPLARIAHWARETPQAAALQSGVQVLDYFALNQRVEQMAASLRGVGAGADTIVALALPRSAELVIAALAVMRSGAAYLPLDPQWPQGRRQQLADTAQPLLVVGEGAALEGHRQLDWQAWLAEPATALELPLPAPEQAAYVLFTSGSTGQPKGVVIEHRQLNNYVQAVSQALELNECRRFALTSTVAADLGNTCLFGAFEQGACLVIASAEDMQDAPSFARFLGANQVDCLKMVPSHLAALLDDQPGALPATVVLGGEATPLALAERIRRQSPGTRLFNHYGPTEATVGVLCQRVDDDAQALGTVLANNVVVLLDDDRRRVPAGAVGELYLGGAQLCRGYVQVDQSAFIDDPDSPGQRLYRTGDRAVRRHNGSLELRGRADGQVKIRGFRVELGEVECTLQGLAEAAVKVIADAEGVLSLVAYVVCDEAGLAVLRQQVDNRLPEAMRPSRYMRLPSLPRLANGKIDRQALPEVQPDIPAGRAPRDALETLLAGHMAELLGRESLDIDSDFFQAGGHSLTVIKLVAAIRKGLQLEVAPGIVFDHPSVASLAAALRERESAPGQLEKAAGLRLKLAALSPAQREALLARR
ncbi:non-ribosomal peptide synthetase [Pseudomonas sp.]|uniref:non-ribosomal peptide synthetase n=1 Tax=Pseudomonas sp. TaxID=306 RepID=UPI003CC5A9B3